jgi:hypothetical protein
MRQILLCSSIAHLPKQTFGAFANTVAYALPASILSVGIASGVILATPNCAGAVNSSVGSLAALGTATSDEGFRYRC